MSKAQERKAMRETLAGYSAATGPNRVGVYRELTSADRRGAE